MVKPLQHIAFIMDGNGRWATAQGLSRLRGHEEGAKTLRKIIEDLVKRQVPVASFFVFSSENWRRPAVEVTGLMTLLGRYLQTEYAVFKKHNIRVKIYGDLTEGAALPRGHIRNMHKLMEQTANHTGLQLNLCINYGGHDEIFRAAKALYTKVADGEIALKDVTPEALEACLDTKGTPPIDICIRTGGECRLSNFMLWQLSYAELFFTQTFWPAFSEVELADILQNYQSRQRRFGKLPAAQAASG